MEPKGKVCVRERGRERGEEYVGYRGEKGERETQKGKQRLARWGIENG